MSPATTLAVAVGDRASISGGDTLLVLLIAGVALAALGVAVLFGREVLAASAGAPRMQEISSAVQEGARAYLVRQFRTLAVFAVIVFVVLLFLPADDLFVRAGRSIAFLLGGLASALVGYVGMTLATRANVRVAAAAEATGNPGTPMRLAFRSGGVVGMLTVGLGLLGAAVVLLVFNENAPTVLEGFAFGGALLAMFMRVGGGIFTKAADVGADLVGKVEQGIPEDDPRNPATIADNVGDNVGDCAGMAADLFESYAVTLVAALILGQAAFGSEGLVFPLIVPAVGVLTAVAGVLVTRYRVGDKNAMSAINRGFFISAAISAVLVAAAAFAYLPGDPADLTGAAEDVVGQDGLDPRLVATAAVIIGLVLAAAIQVLTGYFTEVDRKPVRDIGEASETGAATVVLAGISVGLESAVYSALLIGAAVYAAFLLGGTSVTLSLFAVALAGTGLLTTVGVIVAMDTFGPISDNAQGIAEMSGEIGPDGAAVLTELDAVGNTTKAITKGIAIATAVLAATALFGSFRTSVVDALEDVGSTATFSLSVDAPNLLFGLIIGAAVVFLFSGLAISAVARAAGRVVLEVREQFRTRPGIMDGTERPDYSRVVDICTRDSLRELATPGLLAVLSPVAVGFFLGYGPLGAFLAGAIAAGVLMAVFLANSGGAWDNAKKLVEDGHHGGKGSEAHEATVIGDTIGDPFKDTAGPALNPLLKVMNLVALLIAPSVVALRGGSAGDDVVRLLIATAATAIICLAVIYSKRQPSSVASQANAAASPAASPAAGSTRR